MPAGFLDRPFAHRALHDAACGRVENSRAAIAAAIAETYAIELDLQLSADGVAMVFHDDDLFRLTGRAGAVAQKSAGELGGLGLLGSAETIPSLAECLALVRGQVPLLLELKDQTGVMGPGNGALEAAVARDLDGYPGAVALMSFNPHSVARLADYAPDRPRGLTTSAFAASDWPALPAARRAELRRITDIPSSGAVFVSHDSRDLQNVRLRALRDAGCAVLTWTIRTPEAEIAARSFCDQITFEGYRA